ncbi:MAG: hypothetical protein FJW27_18100 [Acidimicrobiia bacterium]|nr:hypothetical protein [Acidimicrobiia bacterium]
MAGCAWPVTAMGVVGWLVAITPTLPLRAEKPPSFADRIHALSEPPGYFDTDNLISNESSYLHVIPDLLEQRPAGGVYIGVGPDQNFSYIARARPAVAYLVDIRRDNLLLHLLFKALFDAAPTRVEYLCLLIGRSPPPAEMRAKDLTLPEVIGWVERATRSDREVLRTSVERRLRAHGVPLSPQDLQTIARFHSEFIEAGLELQFRSHGRPPNVYYPTLRALLMATDRAGRRWSYLDSEEAYRFVRMLHGQHAIIPVVGDLSGPHALKAIAAELRANRSALSVIYVSNVENYLSRGRRFRAFVENLQALPRQPRALLIRSIFGGGPSVSEVQSVDDLIAGVAEERYRSHGDIIYRNRR